MANDKTQDQEELNSLLSQESSVLEKIVSLENDVKNVMKQKLQLRNEDLQTQKSFVQFVQAGLDIDEKRVQNARDLAQLGNKILQVKVQDQNLNNANLASEQSMYDASNKQKLIHNQNYQTGLLMAETKDGIVDAEEAILKIIRDKKKLEDPLYKAKKEELKLLEKKEDYENKSRENGEKIKGFFEDINVLASDPKIAAGVFTAVMLKNGVDFAATMSGIGGDMGLSRDQSMEMAGDLGVASIKAFAFGISAKEIGEAFAGVSEQMGSMTPEMVGMAENAAHMAKRLKLSGSEAGKLFALTSMIDGGSADTAEATLKTVENLARGANVPIGKVMKDVANSADLIASFGYDNVEALGKAAVEAAKMGTSLDQMGKTASKLMDIDNARNEAMQLSVLLNRSIDVSKAQQLIYSGDLEGGYKEMLSQLGGIDAFNKMDYFQKEKAAALMGLSTGEMQKQLNLAAGLTETGSKQAEGWAAGAGFLSDGWEFAKGNAETLVATLALTKSLGNTKIAMYLKEKAHMLWKKAFGGGGSKIAQAAASGPMKADGTPDMRFNSNKGLLSKIQKPVDSGNKLTTKMNKMPKKDGNVISRFFNSFSKVKWGSIAKGIVAMIGMGIALLAFVPGFAALASVPVKGILAGIGTLIAMTVAMKLMGKSSSSILKGSAGLLIMGAALIPAAFAFGMIADVPVDAMIGFAAVLGVLGLAVALIGMLGTLPIGAAGLLIMAIAMIPAALAFQMIAGIPMGEMWNFAAVISVLGLAFAGIGMLGTLPIGALGLLLMAPAMIIAAVAFQMVAGLPMGEMWNFAAVLSVLALAIAGIGFLPTIFIGAAGLMMIAAAMIPAALAFQMVAGVPVENMIAFAAVLIGLGGAFAFLGFGAGLIVAGSLAMLVAAGSLIVFGTAMGMIPTELMQGEQMLMMAAGMGAMGAAGVAMLFGAPGFMAMSMGLVMFAGALTLIAPLLPVIEKLAQLGIIGDVSVGGEGGGKKGGGGEDDENVVVAKLDELIALISQGGKVVMDGREVGKVINLAIGPQGS